MVDTADALGWELTKCEDTINWVKVMKHNQVSSQR